MKKIAPFLLVILLLAGCSAGGTKETTSTHSSQKASSTRQSTASKRKKPDLTAAADDLAGHTFVAVDDHNQALQFYADTAGYLMDVLTREPGADFVTSRAGVFNAQLATSGSTYTLTGTAQPNAASGTVRFEKRGAKTIRQLPDGPTYRRVKNDDLSTVSHPDD